MSLNPKWLEDRILEILQEIKDLKEVVKAVPAPDNNSKGTK
jgi:hypothetical protein